MSVSQPSSQQFCLRWNNHQPNFVSVFSSLLNSQALTDVTLAAEGQHLEAHRVVLSACSTYFQSLFTTNKSHLHPIVILKDVLFRDLRTMVDFMYSGEVHVSQEQLPSLLKTAETLKIKGLAEVQDLSNFNKTQEKQLSTDSRLSCEALGMSVESGTWGSTERRSPSPSSSPSASQRRKRMRKSSTGSTSESTVTERTSEEAPTEVAYNLQSPGRLGEQQTSSQLTMSADLSERSGSLREQTSTDSDLQNCSQDSGEPVVPVHQQTAGDVSPEIHEPPQQPQPQPAHMQQPQHPPPQQQLIRGDDGPAVSPHMDPHHYTATLAPAPGGGKARKGRLLRQDRIKKDIDPSASPESDSESQVLRTRYLQVPNTKIERQRSEPIPSTSTSCGKSYLQVPSPGGVGGAHLQKQHSHPLLPSQQTKAIISSSRITTLTRQTTIDISSEKILPVIVTPEETLIPSTSARPREPIRRASSTPQPITTSFVDESERLGHCPCQRPGPALGCNFCWNTIDSSGRILRRKTKYYCPECQTNLCIVPCFQQYHEKFDKPPTTKSSHHLTTSLSAEPSTSC